MKLIDGIASIFGLFALIIVFIVIGVFILALIFALPDLLVGLLKIFLVLLFIIAAPILFAIWIAWDFISSLGGKSK